MPREGPKLQYLMQGLQAVQKGLALAQQDLEEIEVTGSAGGGLVTVVMRGTGEVTSIKFNQAAVDEGNPESLGTLTVTALRSATDALKSATRTGSPPSRATSNPRSSVGSDATTDM